MKLLETSTRQPRMALYLTLSQLPELAALSRDERRRLRTVARRRLRYSWRFWGVGLVGGFIAAFLSAFALRLTVPMLRVLAEGGIIGAYFFIWEQAAFAQARPYLRAALANGPTDPSGSNPS